MEQQLDINDIMGIVHPSEYKETDPLYHKWEKLVRKSLKNKFFLSFNLPVLFLGLCLWSGLFGGLWFVHRGRFFFGTFIWPVLAAVTTMLTLILLGALVSWDWTRTNWLITLAILSPIITQFLLASIANNIYLYWLKKKMKKGEHHNFVKSKRKKIILSFFIIFIISAVLSIMHFPSRPPLFFWA